MRAFTISALVYLLLAAAGCAPGEMHPGSSCARCHAEGGGFGKSAPFGAAGTVYSRAGKKEGVANVAIDITDSRGRSVSLISNEVGNFYTGQRLTPPLEVRLSRAGAPSFSATAPSGDCNGCHGESSALGRVWAP
jgi:hypothetical protein